MSNAHNIPPQGATERHHFTTTGITCSGCANSAANILGRLPGVVNVHIDALRKTAEVEVLKGALSIEDLVAALKPAGYGLLPKAA